MAKEVFVVTQYDTNDRNKWVEGVFASIELAQAYVVTQEEELAEDGMEESYEFDIEKTFLVEE
jgi:hypothetical protein